MTDHPNADQIAEAIVAAARAVAFAPFDVPRIALAVASGQKDKPGPLGSRTGSIAKARAYAAMALRARFKASASYVDRVVGSRSVGVYCSQLSQDISKGRKGWWNDAVFDHVSKAVEAARVFRATPEPAPENNEPAAAAGLPDPVVGVPLARRAPDPLPPPSPPGLYRTPGQRAAYEDLRRAVENTAKLQPRDT